QLFTDADAPVPHEFQFDPRRKDAHRVLADTLASLSRWIGPGIASRQPSRAHAAVAPGHASTTASKRVEVCLQASSYDGWGSWTRRVNRPATTRLAPPSTSAYTE